MNLLGIKKLLWNITPKCLGKAVFHFFFYFAKAFDTVNREFLLKILGKLGCSPKFVRLIQSLSN